MKRYTKLAIIGLALALASCKPASEEVSNEPPLVIKDDAVVLATGSFEGRNDHVVTGGVEVLKSGDEYIVTLGADFAEYARLCRARGFRVERAEDLEATLIKARDHAGPSLVEAMTDALLV